MKNNTIKTSKEDLIFDIVSYAVIAILVLACFYPMWYVFCASLSDPTVVAGCKGVLFWPQKLNLDAYRRVFSNPDIWTGLKNTVLYTVVGTTLNVLLTAMLAYALSRKNVMLKKPLTLLISFTMFFNGGMIPTYLVIRDLGLLDHRFAVILPGLVSVFNFIIMRTHFESIPDALEESAKIDGANQWTIFWKIYMPVSATSLAVMTLFYGVSHWNGWMNAMLYLPNSRELFPLALITREIVLSSATSAMNDGAALTQEMADAIKYATIIVSTLPILCLYPFLQQYFTKGVMVGSVKG
ncbi:MAG: carbohydrate ABC transporter permease [Oscillospiraceae bacterium]|jgi:putative aldouronate transport system permease protein|nr:carbohydrate ABC transporter permease [Oscillospiraceae bacterium]